MKQVFNSLKGAVFLLLGIALICVPYTWFKEVFPAAPAPLFIKVLGAVIMLCGVVVLAAVFME